MVLGANGAGAHPFGAASVNRYLGVEVSGGGAARVAYVLDFAELPAVNELARLDADGDGRVLPAERDAYLDALVPGVLARWSVEVDGQRVRPNVVHRALEAPPGDNGLNTLRVLLEVSLDGASAPQGGTREVRVFDDAYAERSGWRELRAEGTGGASVEREETDGSPDAGAGERRVRRENRARFVFRLRERAGASMAPAQGTTATATARHAFAPRVALFAGALLVLLVALFAGANRAGFSQLDVRVRLLASVALGASAANASGPAALGAHAAVLGLFALAAGALERARWWAPRVAGALAWGAFAGLSRGLSHTRVAGLPDGLTLGARVALCIAAALPLAAGTTPLALADGLARLRLPRALVEGVTATARGLAILRDEAERLARARRLRAPDAGFFERVSLWGTLAAALLRRGLARADRSQLALALRGFDGGDAGLDRAPLGARGWAVLAATLVACVCAHGLGARP